MLAALKVRQERVHALEAAIARAERLDVGRFERKAIERAVQEHVAGWRALLTKHVQDGRTLLRQVLAGPLRFTPDGRSYRFEGEAAIGRMLAGVAGLPPFGSSPMPASWNQIAEWLKQIEGLRLAA